MPPLPQPAHRDPGPSERLPPRALDQAFAALADPTRRAILGLLLEDDMAVTDVASAFPVSLAAVSRHLQVLAEAGLIAQERRGRITWCKLLPDGLREASAWMAGFGMIEGVDLDGLERFLKEEVATSGDPSA
jgi:DNA-binding transcriptional ArsR family regulator